MTHVRNRAEVAAEPDFTERVLGAVLEMCREQRYEELTLAAAARRSGAAEDELTARWPAKNLLVMEALLHAVAPHMKFPDTGDIAADLEAQLAAVIRLFADPGIGPHLTAVIADVHADERLAAAFRKKVYGPNRTVARARFEVAQRQGQLRQDIDLDTAVDLVFGPIWFRLLLGTSPLTAELATHITDHALAGLARAGEDDKGYEAP
ncbi:TetR-like C-terminal domain-containing protein [Streptomyces boninensis]|uniref:TetR-like C-terminal domain-containing protein n=1 Tax=Streptomyces boninensis TaxID=2039455 RepID=UPI003B20C24C